jgi:tetratricopeptide (TPR) repeat protein
MLRKGDITSAIFHLEASLREDPTNKNTQGSLMLAKLYQKKIGAAADSFLDATHFDPGDPGLESKLNAVSRCKAAVWVVIDQYLDALSLQPKFNPDDVNIDSLPRLQHAMQAYEEALQRFHQAAARYTDNAAACYHLACIYARKNRIETALLWLERAVQRGFKDVSQITKDRDLIKLRSSETYRRLMNGYDEPKRSAKLK